MESNLRSELLTKAIKRAALYLAVAIVGFLVLGFSAIYLPENLMLRHTESSEVKDWLPGKDIIPSGMVLIERYKMTNEDVAEGYSNHDEVLRLIEGWGREDGYRNLYLSKDRCTTAGPRLITLSIILHKDEAGAQQYLEWMREMDQTKATEFGNLYVGNGGYQFWLDSESSCPEKPERQIEIVFRRNYALGTVVIAGTKRQDDQLLEAAIRLAKVLDENIQKKTDPR